MPRRKIEILLRRSIECEKLSLAAGDVSIRNKCAELAMEYRGLAEKLKADIEEGLVACRLSSGVANQTSARDRVK